MALQTNVKVRVIGTDDSAKNGVTVAIGNPDGAVIQSQITDAGGYALFTALDAAVYAIAISGSSTRYEVKNTYAINPDTIPFENKTFATSTLSGANIWSQNHIVKAGEVTNQHMAPNVITDFVGGVQVSANIPSFYSPNTNEVILWSGTNVGQQYDNAYVHSVQDELAVQSTTIKINI